MLENSDPVQFEPITYFGLVFIVLILSTGIGLLLYRRVQIRRNGLNEPFSTDRDFLV